MLGTLVALRYVPALASAVAADKAFHEKPESQIFAKRSATFWRCGRFPFR